MFNINGFESFIDKQNVLVKPLNKESEETVTSTVLKLKVDKVGDSQVFLNSFEKLTGIQNISSLFNEHVAWDKIGFDCTDFDRMKFQFDIDDAVQFDAYLRRIDIVRKYKKGVLHYIYSITIEKESDPTIDGVIANSYVKKYTRDANDKRVLQSFNILIKEVV